MTFSLRFIRLGSSTVRQIKKILEQALPKHMHGFLNIRENVFKKKKRLKQVCLFYLNISRKDWCWGKIGRIAETTSRCCMSVQQHKWFSSVGLY